MACAAAHLCAEKVAAVHVNKEHDPQAVRRQVGPLTRVCTCVHGSSGPPSLVGGLGGMQHDRWSVSQRKSMTL